MFRPFKIKTLLFLAIFQSCNSDGISDAISEPTFQFKWAKLLSGPTNEDEIDAVASDSQGNVYVSGKYEQDLKIEGQSTPIEATGNKADIMIVKYNKEGIWQWTRNFGSTGEDNIFDAVCDVQGNLILSGYFEGTVAFGDFELTSQAGLDMVLLKISPDGTVLKAIALGGNGDDGGNEVAIGNDNEIIVGAQSNGTFEGIPNTGNVDAYIMSFTNDLVLNWVRAIKGGGDARAKAVEVDDNGNVYLGGDYRNANSVDVNGTSKSFENFGGTDAFIASWTSSGVFRWVENLVA